MTDRTVKVLVSAQVNGYLAGMDQVARKTKDATKATAEQSAALKSLAQTGGVALTAVGVAATGAATLAIAKYAEFDQAMSFVAATGKDAKDNQDALRDAAIKAGAATVFSATQSANAIEEMAKAGVSAKNILAGGLTGALNLASAGGLGVADAASIAATALTQFGLKGTDMSHVADLLSAGAGKAQGEVTDLSEALKFVGPVAHGMGVSIEETTGALALFASQGILADQAGTGLRGVLGSLTSPSGLAKKELDRLGVTLYDSQGKFLGLANMAGQLEQAYGGMTDAQRDASLGTIFGNQQITTARILLDQGRKGIEDWTKAVDDQGFAARAAAERLDNLRGDLEQLGGAFDTALIKMGSAADGVLRGLVQTATDAVTAFGELPAWVQGTTLVVVALTGAIGLLSGGFLLLLPRIMETAAALDVLSASSIPAVARAAAFMLVNVKAAGAALAATSKLLLGPWGLAMLAAAGGVQVLTNWLVSLRSTSDQVQKSLGSASDAAELFKVLGKGRDVSTFRDITADLNNMSNMLDRVKAHESNIFDLFNSSTFGFTNTLRDAGTELGKLATEDLPAAQHGFSLMAKQTDGSKAQLDLLFSKMPDYRRALEDVADAQGLHLDKMTEAEKTTALLQLAQEQATGSTEKSTAAIQEQQAATEAATQAQDEWAKMVSDSDTAFVDLQGALDTIIQKNKDTAQVTADATKSSKDSWQDYYDGVSFSLGKYLTDLQKQVDAQTNWERNMILLSGRASQGVIDELAKMGPKGAPLVAELVDASDDELAKMEGLYTQRAAESTGAFADTLSGSAEVIKAASAQLGSDAANEIATKLANGTATVQQIIAEYALKISSVKPKVVVEVGSNTDPATRALNEWLTANANHRVNIAMGAGGSGGITRATGGILPGPPSSRDNMLVNAASGEFITRASQTAIPANRRALEFMNAGGVIPGYASGGMVGFQPAPVYTPAPPRQYMPGPGPAQSPQFNVVVKSKGGIDLLRYVDVSIESAFDADGQVQERGYRG